MHFYFKDWVLQLGNFRFSGLTACSYVFDWLFYLAILVSFSIYGSSMPPRYHEFSLHDTSLMHTYREESETTIPLIPLVSIAIGFSVLQFIICSLVNYRDSSSRKVWDIASGLMCLCGGMAIQLMITCILKNICGLPRPDLISRCQPAVDTNGVLTFIQRSVILATIDICTNDNIQILQEGFRSFPSGHSSTIFCGMIISSLNISGKWQVFDRRGVSLKVVLALFPIMVACFVSCTRISDNRHYLRDVIGGSVIGSTVGVWFYSQYFPSVLDLENCGRAYPPRRIGVANFFGNVGGFWKIYDKLPGAFEDRNLNSDEIIEEISQLGELVTLDSEPRPDLVTVSLNIEYINRVSKELGKKYINLAREDTAVC